MKKYIGLTVSLAVCRDNCRTYTTGTLEQYDGLYQLGSYWFSKDLVRFIEETDEAIIIFIDRP